MCNGATYNKADYPDLFNAIGTIYGGDGTTNFKVPDFRGVFLRGLGSTSVTTTPGGTITAKSAGLGIKQADGIRNIYGRFSARGFEPYELIAEGVFTWDQVNGLGAGHQKGPVVIFNFNANKIVPTSNENRPVNYAVNYYIKY